MRLESRRPVGESWCHLLQWATQREFRRWQLIMAEKADLTISKLVGPTREVPTAEWQTHTVLPRPQSFYAAFTQAIKKAGLLEKNRYVGQTAWVFQEKGTECVLWEIFISYWPEEILQKSKSGHNVRGTPFFSQAGEFVWARKLLSSLTTATWKGGTSLYGSKVPSYLPGPSKVSRRCLRFSSFWKNTEKKHVSKQSEFMSKTALKVQDKHSS